MTTQGNISQVVEKLFAVGAHLGFSKSRRHARAKPFVLSTKNGTDIINLEKTEVQFASALEFMKELGKNKKTIMLVGTKPEIRSIVQNAADKISMPFVVNRWVGGMLTNFSQMKKRMEVKDNITDMKTTGEIEKYTKKERLLIGDKEAKLENLFGGMQGMLKVPDALLVVDARHESIAIREASMLGIQTISLLNTDCDIKDIAFPIVGNDASRESVSLFLNELVSAYEAGSHTSA